jgi:hypothetical protein
VSPPRKTKASKTPKAAAKTAPHKRALITQAKRAAAPPPPADEGERDYLVIYEEPDPYGLPSDDVLVLDIDARTPKRGEVDVQQKLELELTNTTSRLGTAGYATTLVGCVLGIILMIAFATLYPADWYPPSGSANTVRAMILLSVLTIALMIAGTVLTHYGRRIQARSRLSDVRIIEKASQNRATFE